MKNDDQNFALELDFLHECSTKNNFTIFFIFLKNNRRQNSLKSMNLIC